jgi:AbrB family looped-hinge helix DNA binding protein
MQTVTITSQGQVTIPKKYRDAFGIEGSHKATVERVDEGILIKPQKDFWSLMGSMKTDIVATDEDLRNAREKFSEEWGKRGV